MKDSVKLLIAGIVLIITWLGLWYLFEKKGWKEFLPLVPMIIASIVAVIVIYLLSIGEKKENFNVLKSDGCPKCAIKDCEGPLKPFGICGCKCPEGESFKTEILTLNTACARKDNDFCPSGWRTTCDNRCLGPVY